ncbi:putative RNA-directed DNA polymerase from transposon X-element [Trichonephila clavipes]|nr:putative RNA-directed DNA polymerase from transposon X-element [Trichonephila clavipes]
MRHISFHDEAHFWLNGYVNKQNCRIWSEANPQVYVETPLHPEKLTVWCALWAGGIIGPYFFKNDEGHNVTVNGDRYRAMITNFFIPELNNHDVQELWFQQDGATCHTARATIDLLKDTFGDRLISRFGPVNWPPRSCDLTPLDYFLWGYVKSLVYADKPQALDHLEDNIRRVIADIRPQMLEKVIENWTSRLDYIRASRGSHRPEIRFKIVRSNSTRAQLRPNAHSLTFNFNVQSLSICFWNANGFRPKICEVRDFVSEQNPDLLLVQETKLQPGLDPLIANYRLHKDDRNNFSRSRIDGGIVIYCKNNYDHNRVASPTLQYMDATAIEIKFNNPPIRIVSAYARNTPENNRKFPDKDFLKILNSGQNIIIAGDLNAAHRTWSNARSNAFGYALRKIVINKSNVRIVAPHTPTHINASSRPGARDSIIDLAVLKNIPFNHDIRVIDDLESDLLPDALGSVATHPLEKAEVIADSLQKQFEPNTEAENDRFTARTQRKIKRLLDTPTCLDLEKTTPGEVQEYIKKLKINKSPGLDLITNRILKNLPLKFVLFIVMRFNLLMENCHFSKNWKTAPYLNPILMILNLKTTVQSRYSVA